MTERPKRSFFRRDDRPSNTTAPSESQREPRSARPERDTRAPREARPDDKKPFERKPFDRDKKPFSRDAKPFDRDKKPFERKPFDRDAKPFDRDKKPFERKPFDRDKKPFSRDAKPFERKPFDKDRKPFEKKPSDRQQPFEGDRFEGDRGQSMNMRSRRTEEHRAATKSSKIKGHGPAPIKLDDPLVPVRLNRFIAMSGVCSRREADELIAAGEVTVNGIVVTELGTKVMRSDKVVIANEQLKGEKKVYIVMNKPKGFVTSVEDPHNDRTVMELLEGKVRERIYPIGRLDKNTTGVLLLTNDGDLTRELTHPSFAKSKIYHVFLDKPCTEEDLEKLAQGFELEDGEIHADEVSFVEGNRKEVGIELHSGRNRIVRRMFDHLDYDVVRLDRVYFAGFTKMGLRRGFWRHLTEREVATLRGASYK